MAQVTGGGAWLISMVMWFNCLRWVPEQGIAVREVERLAGTKTNWNGMQRWGHIYFEPSPDDRRPKPPQSAMIVRATGRGRDGQEVWRVLIPEIEARWRERFGAAALEKVRKLLLAIASELDPQFARLPADPEVRTFQRRTESRQGDVRTHGSREPSIAGFAGSRVAGVCPGVRAGFPRVAGDQR